MPRTYVVGVVIRYIFKYLIMDSGGLGALTISAIAVFLFTIQVLVVTGTMINISLFLLHVKVE